MKKYLSIFIAFTILITPGLSACAAEQVAAFAPIVITEISPGSTQSGSQEFIELYNQSDQVIDLGKEQWEVQIATSLAKDWTKAKKVELSGTFYPGTYYLLASTYVAPGDAAAYLAAHASSSFTAGMTASSGHVRLIRELSTVDAAEWSMAKDGAAISPPLETLPNVILEQSLAAGSSLKRRVDTGGAFSTTGEVFVFSLCPSPTATNQVSYAAKITNETKLPLVTVIDVQNQQCMSAEDPETEEPITQSPVEPPATLLPPPAPTIAAGPKQKSIPLADIGLLAPQLTELLPNPASPQTDLEDEYIELYNPNDATYDLSGFMMYVGVSGSKKYTFPEGTQMAPRSFKAFFSGDTRLSLANSAGQVRLVDPLDRELSITDAYPTAKENQSWSRVNGTWQWTTVLTPHAANVLQAPIAAAKVAKKTTSKPASTITKQANTRSSAQSAPVAQQAAATVTDTPVHPWVLAGVGGLALLYGAYEYRRDVANKFYQFRCNRAARRANRSRIEGRRGD